MMNEVTEDKFMTMEEAAAFLGISKGTLNNLCCQHRITFFKPFRRRLFKKEDLIKVVTEAKNEMIQ